ncbi:MAG: M81 family metallopeptidase [Advenella sp.]
MAASSRKKIAVARFWYEGNAFSPVPGRLEDFHLREWSSGDAALAAARGTATELGAVDAFARQHPEWEVTVLRCASAMPAGPMDDEVFTTLRDDIVTGLSASKFDAIYLSLHGASITKTRKAPDIELLRAVRECAPGVPVGASFDLHANLGQTHAALLDVAAGYRTYPHIDMYETAERVLAGLVAIANETVRTVVHICKPGLILPSFNMRTEAGPMRELQAQAVSYIDEALLDVAVFGGFPYADSPDTGASVMVVSNADQDHSGQRRRKVMDRMLSSLHDRAGAFEVTLPTPKAGIDQALAILRDQDGLVAVVDPGDNPLSGGTNDTPGFFRAVIETVDLPETLFMCFTAPDVVAMAHEQGPGSVFDAQLGARHSTQFGEPVAVRVQTIRLTDGEFVNQGPMENGRLSRCGRTALFSIEGKPQIQVIVTESVAPTHDPGILAMHGIDLAKVRLLCVKAKNHFRAAFNDRCLAIIDVDAPGPAALNLRSLPFRYAGLKPGM